jgi:hypothetical protein
MSDLIEELKQLTAQAIADKKKKSLIEKDNKSEKERLRHESAKARAEFDLLNILNVVKEAACNGKNEFRAANTKRNYNSCNDRMNTFFSWNKNDNYGLRMSYLHQMLSDKGFDVTVEFAHDGVGIESWYEMYIKW